MINGIGNASTVNNVLLSAIQQKKHSSSFELDKPLSPFPFPILNF